MKITEVKQLLENNNIFPNKKYGQNFLINQDVINQIVKLANIDEDTLVVEIGPGLGAITLPLSQKCGKLICYEIDPNMVNILQTRIDPNKVIIKNIDFLKANLEEDLLEFTTFKTIKVVANLPYYITTPIIEKILTETTKINELILMVQKEVSDRFIAKPSTKEYGYFTVVLNLFSKVKPLMALSPNFFYPVPKVSSELILVEKVKNEYNAKFLTKLTSFIGVCFNNRRKTIINNISNNYGISKEKLTQIFIQNNYDINARAETLNHHQFIELFNLIFS